MPASKSDAKNNLSPEDRRMHIQLALLALAVMINIVGFSVIIPLVPEYVQRGLHLPLTARAAQDPRIGEYGGWLTAVYALMQFFFAPFWGQLSDRIGRKPILVGSLLGDALFYTLFGLSTHSIYGQFAARILAGIFSSASLAVAQAYAADITPPNLRAMGLGYLGAAFGVGFIFGPALGGLIGQIGLSWPLYFSALLALVNTVYIARFLPEPERAAGSGPQATGFTARVGQMAQAVRGPIGFLYLLTFAVTFAFGNLEGTFTAYLKQHFHFAHSTVVAGGVFAYVGVLIVIIQGGLIRPLVKKYGEPTLIVVGIGLMAAGFLLFPLAPALSALLLGPMIPIAVGSGLNSPSLRSLVSRKATAQGAALGLSASFDSLARATGPATAGYLYRHIGQAAPYWCAGLVMSLCFFFALSRRREMAAPLTLVVLGLLLTGVSPARAQSSSVPPPQYGPWRSCEIGGGGYAQNVVLCPSALKRCYAYIDVGGMFRSDDGGQTWRMLHGGLPAGAGIYETRGLNVDPRNADVIVAAIGSQWAGETSGIYRSADGGATWQRVLAAGFMGNGTDRWNGFLLTRSPKDANVIVAATEGTGVFRSADNGLTWQKMGLEGLHPTDIRFARADDRHLWLCARPFHDWLGGKMVTLKAGFYSSNDGGTTWTELTEDSPSEILQDPVAPAFLFGILDNRVAVSYDGGANWSDRSIGLPAKGSDTGNTSESSFQALAAGPDFIVTASTKGTFYTLKAGPGPSQWQKVARQGLDETYCGQPWFGAGTGRFGSALGSITTDPRDPAHWFFTDWFSIYQTRDSGKHWRLTMDGVETTVLHCLTQDPADPGAVHLGMADNGYFLSENGGVRFAQGDGISNNIKCVSVCPTLPARVYAVGPDKWDWFANQVFVSVDRGHHWTRSPMTGLPDMATHRCNTIAADPKDPYTVYLCVSGNVAPNDGGVYKSTDGGKSWQWIGTGLPMGQSYFTSDIWNTGLELAILPDGTMAAISRDHSQVFRWNPAAQAWAAVSLPLKGQPYSVIAAADTLYLGVEHDGIYKSADGGAAWTKVWNGSVHHVAADAAHPTRLAAGTDDGVIVSTDGGATWTAADRHLPYRFYNLVAFAGDRLLAGSSGNGAFWMPLSPAGAKPAIARPTVPAFAPGAAFVLPALQNGSMTDGTDTPTDWNTLWTASGKVRVVRDTADFQSGPASLRLESVGGSAYGTTAQSFSPSPGSTPDAFQVTGFVKSAGTLEEALFAVQAMDATGKQLAWITLANAAASKTWQAFSGTVQLPRETAHWNLTLTLKGDGKVWLDDVKLTAPPRVFK